MIDKRKKLPIVPLRAMVVLPEQVLHFDITKKQSVQAIEQAMKSEKKILLATYKSKEEEAPSIDKLYEHGCIAEIKQVIKLPKDIVRVLVVGRTRGRIIEVTKDEECLTGVVEEVENDWYPLNADAMQEERRDFARKLNVSIEKAQVRELREKFAEYAEANKKIRKEAVKQSKEITKLGDLIDFISGQCMFEYIDLQAVLSEEEVDKRFDLLAKKLEEEIQIHEIRDGIQKKVKKNIDKSQKEFYLREQLKVIRKELGEDPVNDDADQFMIAGAMRDLSSEITEKIFKEVGRFRNMNVNSAEHGILRTYIETMLEIPWEKQSEDSIDIASAKVILDEEHYGLDEVKERILEFLAVRSFTTKGGSPILCLVGPPGTGKTSIAKSLANAMNKSYVRISLGGVHDEAEIRGHRRTYIGSMPGRIANGLIQAGTKNPLMLLDEIDKVSNGHKGDTHSALLEVLDSEQNMNFRDHYLEVPLDLSEVLFVATANSVQSIPKPLLDRMEVIEIHSYTENEKVHIAMEHLVPKQLELHGLTAKKLVLNEEVVEKIARHYTKEAGVRQLERKIATICRKAAKQLVETKKRKIRITEANLEQYLGKEKYKYQMKNNKDEIGVVRGLAWTSVGGTTLQIEAISMPGKGTVTLTGQLGNVMKESATAGISYIRTIADAYDIPDTYFLKHDIHIHIPDGAVPKDGPSAGITMALAILSAVSGKPVRADVAMTGEVTLRGRVLPIGGLKEKLLAAKNAGITTVIIPADNKRDVEEISTEITKELEIIPVEHMSEVCEIAFAK